MQVMPIFNQPQAPRDLSGIRTKLKRLTISLLRTPQTAFYAGVLVMGKNEITEDHPTAYTNGYDCYYNADFFGAMSDSDGRGLIMHEKLHIILVHLPRMRKLFQKNPRLTNAAADFAVNAMIKKLEESTNGFITLPKDGLYDEKYIGWNAVDIYYDLEKNQKENGGGQGRGQQGQGQPQGQGQQGQGQGQTNQPDGRVLNEKGEEYAGNPLDDHGFNDMKDVLDKHPDMEKHVNDVLRQGGMLAGALGLDMPREITEMLDPVVRWEDELFNFVDQRFTKGDEFTWRRYNRRQIANDILSPTLYTETVGALVFGFDTSGSIDQRALNYVSAELVSAIKARPPSKVIVLWWDTMVHGRQDFEPHQYDNIAELLKPVGGGGTRASCVFEYIVKENIEADGVIMMTDGYLETDVKHPAAYDIETLWLIHGGRSNWEAPFGRKINVTIED